MSLTSPFGLRLVRRRAASRYGWVRAIRQSEKSGRRCALLVERRGATGVTRSLIGHRARSARAKLLDANATGSCRALHPQHADTHTASTILRGLYRARRGASRFTAGRPDLAHADARFSTASCSRPAATIRRS